MHFRFRCYRTPYYRGRELVPADMLPDLDKAKIVITNYHAFKPRETLEISKVGRSVLQGRGTAPVTIESEGAMLTRCANELMGLKGVVVVNDEAHQCYREKQGDATRWIRISATWPRSRSNSSSASAPPAWARPTPPTLPTRTCCAR